MQIGLYEYVTAECGPGNGVSDSLRREGQAMVQALHADFQRIPGVQVQRFELHGRDPRAAMQAFAKQCDYTLVLAPEFAEILLTRCRWVVEAGGQLLGSHLEALALTADKLRCGRHLQTCGIPTPPTLPLLPTNLPPSEWQEIIVKPRWGAGSQATFHLAGSQLTQSFAQLTADPEWLGDALVQPFIPGLPVSVAFLLGPSQQLALAPATQEISTEGRCRYLGGSVPLPASWSSRAVALAQRALGAIPGLLGYVGVDLILGPDLTGRGDAVLEINPRVTTSYVGLRRLTRTNLMETLIHLMEGVVCPPVPWHSGRVLFRSDGQCQVFSA